MTQIYKGLVLIWKATLFNRFIATFISKAHNMKYNSHEMRWALPSINKGRWLSLCGRRKYKKVSFKSVQRNSNLSTCEDPTYCIVYALYMYMYCKPLLPCLRAAETAAKKSISDSLIENYSKFPNSVSQELQQTDEWKQELSLVAEEYKPGCAMLPTTLFIMLCSFYLDN